MEHRKVEVRQATGWGTPGDDPVRFLRELRQLRDGAGLGPAELAARAHYPYDSIRAAESGPALPDLPVLSAYVRGCGGTTEEWEERWRTLTRSPALSSLPMRSAGCSAAASAGARIGSISPVADSPDPAVIMRALNRVADDIAAATPSAGTAPMGATPMGATPMEGSTGSSLAGQDRHGQDLADPAWAGPASADRGPAAGTAAASPAVTTPAVASPAATTPAAASPAVASARAAGPATGAAAGTALDPGAAPVSGGERLLVTGALFAAPSRITIAALIAVVICVLVAVLAIFA